MFIWHEQVFPRRCCLFLIAVLVHLYLSSWERGNGNVLKILDREAFCVSVALPNTIKDNVFMTQNDRISGCVASTEATESLVVRFTRGSDHRFTCGADLQMKAIVSCSFLLG